MADSLEVPLRGSRRSGRSRLWTVVAVLGAVGLVAGWVIWYSTSPADLPDTDRTVTAQGVTGTPLYVGMIALPDDFGRSILVREVEVPVTGDDVTVTPLLCRDGAVGVTTSPDQFCSELVEPEGADLAGGDSIVLEVTADEPGEVHIDRLEVAFRERLSWGTYPAGNAGAIVTFSDSAG